MVFGERIAALTIGSIQPECWAGTRTNYQQGKSMLERGKTGIVCQQLSLQCIAGGDRL